MPRHIEPVSMEHIRLMQKKLLEQANAQKRLQEDFDVLKAENKQLKDQLGLQAGRELSAPTFLEWILRLERDLAHLSHRVPAASESEASNQKIEWLENQLHGMERQVKMTPTNGFFFGILLT